MTGPSRLSSQDYLAAIYEMAEESIPTVQAELARWMGVSAASVSEAGKRLRQRGLVTGAGRGLGVTGAGPRAAVRRHRLAGRLLIEVIGRPWHQAHQEAETWEHAISDQVEDRIAAMLGDPPTCPHGNPIPGSARTVDHSDLRPLHAFSA